MKDMVLSEVSVRFLHHFVSEASYLSHSFFCVWLRLQKRGCWSFNNSQYIRSVREAAVSYWLLSYPQIEKVNLKSIVKLTLHVVSVRVRSKLSFFFFSLRKWEFRRIYDSKLLQIKVQWVSIHSLTPLVVTRASKNSFDHTTLSQLSSPGEWCRQTAYSKVYQSEPETVAVSPFDLLNTTLKSLFLSWIFATHFLKPVQRFFLFFFFSLQNKGALWSQQNCFHIKDRFPWHATCSKERH